MKHIDARTHAGGIGQAHTGDFLATAADGRMHTPCTHMTTPPALCHIDGHPCPRARECRMMPYDVCANYCERSAPTLTEAGCRVCFRLRHGKCHGFSCYLAPARPIHETILAKSK